MKDLERATIAANKDIIVYRQIRRRFGKQKITIALK